MAGTITGETKRLEAKERSKDNQLAGTKRKKRERASPSLLRYEAISPTTPLMSPAC
jgi:hypothetical protein